MQVRRRRLLLAGACGILILLVAGIWVVPGMLDWNRYRDGIAALASQQLGRPVRIGGGVSLQLLPQPILTADDVSVEGGVGDEHGAADTGLHARALRLRVALVPLLAGKIDARELTLQGADLRLPWPPPPGSIVQRPPDWLTGLHAQIEEGRLQVGELVMSGITGTVTTDPDTGTLSAAGVMQAGERKWQFTARLARPGRDGAAGLDVSLDGQDKLRDTGGTFSGQIDADGALSGRVAGRGPDLSQLVPAPALAWRGDGRLNAAAGLAIADELALEIGGAPARGAVSLRVQPSAQLDVSIVAGRLDLDAWLPALLGRNAGTLRAGIPTGIDLSAEAATLAGGTLRHLRGGVDLAKGVVHLRDVTAILPGDAQLTLSGQVATEPQMRFEGGVQLAASDLRATLRWLQRSLPAAIAALPPGVLRTATLSATIAADPTQASITALDGTIDGARIGGTASFKLGTRPTIGAALTLDRLTLDPWLPRPAALATLLSQASAQPAGQTPAQTTQTPIQTAAASLRAADTDLKLQVARADWAGIPLGALSLELQSEQSRILLRRLEVQPLGTRLSLSGQLTDAGRLSDARLEASAADIAPLWHALDSAPLRATVMQAWPGVPPLDAVLRGPASLLVIAAGPPDALVVRVTLELADTRLEVQPTVNLPARRWAGPITLHHPGAPRLLETLGVGGTASWLGDGSLSLVGQIAVAPGRVELDGATVSAGALRATGHVVVEGRRVFGEVGFETLPLPMLYPRSPDPLPLAWLRGWQAGLQLRASDILVGLTPVLHGASADVTLQDGVLRFARGAAMLEGGGVTGGATLDVSSDTPRISLQAQATGLAVGAKLFDTPLDILSGQADGSLDLVAAGYSPAALLATLSGTATVQLHEGVASGFDLAAAAAALSAPDTRAATEAARTALLGGQTPFGLIEAPLTIAGGLVATDAKLTAQPGEARLVGSLDLQGGTIDARLTLRPAGAGAPALDARLTGPTATPVRIPELAGLARWLADRPQ